jgi:superfamily I DNA/RNA helicase
VVGDDDQSIYGWRGADISNLLDMEKHFPGVKVIKLEQNYRSTNTILNAANAIIKHNLRRRGKQLWSQKGDGAKIMLHAFADEEEEARSTVEQIEFARLDQRVPWAQHAILFRTNAQSRPLETALRQAGVRYHLIGGQSFFDRREIRDFLAYLKTFLNPNDDISLLRIANVPARGLSDVTMERLLAASQERKCSVFAVMKNPVVSAAFMARTRASIENFVEFIERTREVLTRVGGQGAGAGGRVSSVAGNPAPHPSTLAPHPSALDTRPPTLDTRHPVPGPLSAWAEHFLDETGYLTELRRSEKNADTADNRVRNLKELIATLDGAGDRSESSLDRLQAFLEEITLDTEREEEDEGPGDAVTLITMHSCKGLEFPHVYVVGLEDGLLPHSRSKVEGTLDEERRLFYVAITRAMQTLNISHCAGRKKYGQAMPCHPSPFLNELPPELVEHADEKARQPVTPDSGKSKFAALRAALE